MLILLPWYPCMLGSRRVREGRGKEGEVFFWYEIPHFSLQISWYGGGNTHCVAERCSSIIPGITDSGEECVCVCTKCAALSFSLLFFYEDLQLFFFLNNTLECMRCRGKQTLRSDDKSCSKGQQDRRGQIKQVRNIRCWMRLYWWSECCIEALAGHSFVYSLT